MPSFRRRLHHLFVMAILGTWAYIMVYNSMWDLYIDYWVIALMMVFGSFVAGSTPAGGGAVAFPVMTLLLGMAPNVARDFSVMIQSIGMTSASILIYSMKIHVELAPLLYAGLGGCVGAFLGIELIEPMIEPDFIKMLYVSLGLSLAFGLYRINLKKDSFGVKTLGTTDILDKLSLFSAGFFGGVVSGLTGSGIDLITFSFLVSRFRLNEKVSTPTSVMLMTIISLFIFTYRGFSFGGIPAPTWLMWVCAAPVVLFGAPLGSYMAKIWSKKTLAKFIIVVLVAQYLSGIWVLPGSLLMYGFSLSVVLFGILLFTWLEGAKA